MEVPRDSGQGDSFEPFREGRDDNRERSEGGLTWCMVPSAVLASRFVGPRPSRTRGDTRPDAGGDAFRRLSTSHRATDAHKQIPDNGHAPSTSASTIYSEQSPRNLGNGTANFYPNGWRTLQEFQKNVANSIRAHG